MKAPKIMNLENSPLLTDLSHELLCHILQYLPLKETLSISMLCRKLSSAVSMHLHLCGSIDFCEGQVYGYMPSSITDDHMHSLLRKCPHLEVVYGLHPLKVERRRLRKRSALTVPGIIEALSLCPNLKAIETCDLRLLEAILQHLPQLEIMGHFRNRDGVFPPHASQRLKLQPYPKVCSLHLTGIEVPELTAMPHLQHLHLHCVRFTKLQPFRAFLAQNLRTFVMKHCMGPSLSLRYLSLIIALSSSPSLTRLELVRVPLPGGLFQRAVEDSYRHNGFVNLKYLVIAGCKGVLEADLGHLMIVASKNLESISIQPSLTKDSLFVSLSFARVEFPRLKHLHVGHVEKLNSSGEWSNDILLTLGLAEVPDTPSSLTDSGMKVISELFPHIKVMSVSNCPHLMAMDQWSFAEGGQAWKELTDLTLQRCHCLQLPSFALFLAFLPKIEVVILNDMFREPPKGCSHVGLSAGTGLGMSSAVVSNQDEHIAVQGHQQDFEPQPDEPIENDEIDREYIEADNEGRQEAHLMVFQQGFFDEQNNVLHAPLEQRENFPQEEFALENRAQSVDYNQIQEQNLNSSDIEHVHDESSNKNEGAKNDSFELLEPSSNCSYLNTENLEAPGCSIPPTLVNSRSEMKKGCNAYHLRRTSKRMGQTKKQSSKHLETENEYPSYFSSSDEEFDVAPYQNCKNTENLDAHGCPISPSLVNNRNEMKKGSSAYHFRTTSKRMSLAEKPLSKPLKRETEHPNYFLHSDEEVKETSYQNCKIVSQTPETKASSSVMRNSNSYASKEYNSIESAEYLDAVNNSENYDPYQPSTSKAGNFIVYDMADSDCRDVVNNVKKNSKNEKPNGKRLRKVPFEDKKKCCKRIKKSQSTKIKRCNTPSCSATSDNPNKITNNKIVSTNVALNTTEEAVHQNYSNDAEPCNNKEIDCSVKIYEGPLTRHRKRMFASSNQEFISYSDRKQIIKGVNEKLPHEDIAQFKHVPPSDIKKEIDFTQHSVENELDDVHMDNISLQKCKQKIMTPKSSLSCTSANESSPSCSRYENFCNCASTYQVVSSNSFADNTMPVSIKSEPNDDPTSSYCICTHHSNLVAGNACNIKHESGNHDCSPLKHKHTDHSKCRIRKKSNKKHRCSNRSHISNTRPLTRNQEKMHSTHEVLDIVSQGTQATSADIRRTLRGQKGSNTRQRKTGHTHTRPVPVRHSKISSRQHQRRLKGASKPLQDFHNKATSTSDPLLEDDAVQTLRLVSETLVSLTIVSCGISDVVIDHCHSMSHIEVQACRILKKFQLHYCPSLKRLNISQCPKLDVKAFIPEVLSLETNNNLLVSFEPCMQGYHRAEGEQSVFSKAALDQSVILFHDFTDNSRESVQDIFMENLYIWMIFLQRLWNSLVIQRSKQKRKRLNPEESRISKFPWGHDLRRIYGHYSNPAIKDHPVPEWQYQIVTNNHLFAASLEFFDWEEGFPKPVETNVIDSLSVLPYEVAKRSLQMQKRITTFYIPITELV